MQWNALDSSNLRIRTLIKMRRIPGVFNCTENMLLRRTFFCKCPSTGYNRTLSSFKNRSYATASSFSTLTHRPRCAFFNLIHTLKELQQFSTVAEPANEPNAQGYCASTTNEYTTRTHTCGELRASHIDQAVTLCGWVAFIRMDKFIHLRDAYGTTQIIVDTSKSSSFKDLHLESVVRVKGTVCSRPPSQVVTNLATGEIEVLASSVEILNNALPNLPFHIREIKKATEKTRNQYRYLALRFPEYQRNLRLRSEIMHNMREFLVKKKHFVEVETPTLFKKTPGGAQEFIVPTHLENKFYSLVQSPQQLKQLLMVGSIDRYFQIARCYRDERTTPDRQPEFTQLDLELSFTTVDDVIKLTEDILAASWPPAKKTIVPPFPRMRYADAIERFGSDKPCIFDKFLVESMNEYIEGDSRFAFFYRIPAGKSHYNKLRSLFDSLAEETAVKIYVLKYSSDKFGENLVKIFPGFRVSAFESETTFNENDLLVIAAGSRKLDTLKMLGKCRHQTIDTLGFIDEMNAKEIYDFVWIVDFPLFEEDEGKLVSAHHPFTRPHPEDMDLVFNDPLKARSLGYDLVLNGSEIGGGSVRIHEASLQEEILKKLNLAATDFEHLLDAFKLGCPPHGGIALGLDRLFAILCNTNSIKDVIAFPKGADGQDLMTRCPDDVPSADKIRYHLTTAKVQKKE